MKGGGRVGWPLFPAPSRDSAYPRPSSLPTHPPSSPVTSLSCLHFPPSKTSRGDEQKPEATRASSVPTHAPTWEEEVTVEMDAEDASQAGESMGGLWGQ